MTDNNPHINYSFADIERYLNGGMTAKEMHAVERAALQDPFLADAIDGYRNADVFIADKHLNEIAAALQKEQSAKVIAMPGKKSYKWLVAASLIAVIGGSIFLLKPGNNEPEPLAKNTVIKAQQPGLFEDKKVQTPSTDSQSPSSPELAFAKANTERKKERTSASKEKLLNEKTHEPEQTRLSAESSSTDVAMMYRAPAPSLKVSEPKQPASISRDTITAIASAPANAGYYGRQQAKSKPVNTWTTGNDKPFRLSDVEVITIGKKARKQADTTSVKPEGGWQSFQDYLFSRLSHHDSLQFVNGSNITGNMELEFSIDESGSPYDVTVLHTQDTALTNKIVNAVQSGPKWMAADKKEKRLRLVY